MFAFMSDKHRGAIGATGTRQRGGLRGRGLRGLVGAVLATGLLAAVPAASHASAYGYQYWAAQWTGGIKVLPAGQLFHAIEGSGDHIRVQGGNYLAGGQLCDTSLKFTYGNGSTSTRSDVRRGCSRAQQ